MDKLAQIQHLRIQLGALGYHDFQIDSMIKEEIGTAKLTGLSEEQYEQCIETLQGYIEFASKCQKKK
ncbi:hypothetical protein HSX37_14110|uniref:Uncharacterized protein n=1 Tax=Dendrosporobacter quercicolus TaxID=146817 RepID=A0A1G9WPN2_9FIRM|nr:hypothetical protein [Dendrosporobacter quercicolus]NSL49165.1 hypothetical protein [Dendrosporobacter quercicolus DSM 1736]SDM86123.1 hypothetical protein SAMN04488502_10840 [Dendrosporobacter quercicolus]